MVAWLMVSLKTQTLGPKAATFAPGQIDETASASWDGAAANPRGGGQRRHDHNRAPQPAGGNTSGDLFH